MEPSVSAVLILVVEDEPLLQDMVSETLEEAGFAVAKSSNGENAIRMLDAPDAGFRALLTDVNLDPGMLTGWDVARHARQLDPELPVVYMSGAAGNAWSSEGVPNSIMLTKPFANAQVVTAISQLLNTGTGPSSATLPTS
jgi:CheY-like chemotaxis protein